MAPTIACHTTAAPASPPASSPNTSQLTCGRGVAATDACDTTAAPASPAFFPEQLTVDSRKGTGRAQPLHHRAIRLPPRVG